MTTSTTQFLREQILISQPHDAELSDNPLDDLDREDGYDFQDYEEEYEEYHEDDLYEDDFSLE